MVKNRILRSFFVFALFLLTILPMGCGDAFDVHPYYVDFSGDRNLNHLNLEKIQVACKDKDTLRFVVMGDTQGWYDDTKDLVDDINRQERIDFVIHGGDFTNYGATREFIRQRDIFLNLKMPFVGIIGNHDCLGTGIEVYKQMFGETNFSFIAGRVKFICLNTNALEYDFDQAIPDFDFLESQLHKDKGAYDRTVFCMHARPFSEQFNNNVVNTFNYFVETFPHVLFCTAGHEHRFEAADLFANGVVYYVSDSVNSRSYIIFTVTPSNYTYEIVYF